MSDSEQREAAVVITPYQDGPLIVRGDFQLRSADGAPITVGRKTVALCRCGRSALKPFCDGSHARTGFRAPGGSQGQRPAPEPPPDRPPGSRPRAINIRRGRSPCA